MNKNTTHVPDTTTHKQTQTSQIRHESQTTGSKDEPSQRNGHHNIIGQHKKLKR